MTVTATHAPLEDLFQWEEALEEPLEPVAATGTSYVAPEALAEDVEEAEEKIIQIFYVLVVFLLTLAATLAIAVVIYCWRKRGKLAWWIRLSPFTVKIACKVR